MKQRLELLNQFLLNLITRGRYETYEIEVIRKIKLFNIVTAIGIVILLVLGTVAYFNDIKYLWQVDYIILVVLCLDLFYTQRSQNYKLGLYISIGFFTLLCYYLFFSGGAYQTGYVWYFTYPLIACFGLGARQGVIASAILIIPTFVVSLCFNHPPGTIASYTTDFMIRFGSSFFMISVTAYCFEKIRKNTQISLERKNAELNKAMAELRIADEKLRQAADELENRVKERTKQLSDVNRQLTQEIKERLQTETSLRESEEKYRLITENTADVIAVLDLNLRFTYVSPSSVRIRGFTPDEVMAQTLDQAMTPESMQRTLVAFAEEMKLEADGTADPARIRIMEMEQYRKDGSTVWLEVSLSMLRGHNGEPVGILAACRDISERKRAEAERNRLEAQLEQAQKLESIGTLAGGIAHDFNNLLMGIQGNVSLLLMDTDPSHPNHERLTQIEQQVASGSNLTKQVLGFARKGRYDVKPTNMNDIVDKTLAMFRRMKKDVSICRKQEEHLWPADVDSGQMEQVLLNLYINAGQAMPQGGEITLTTENVLLEHDPDRPDAVNPGKYVKLSISDTGTGMDEKTLKRIFDPFFTTKVMGRGTGLGLAMVYGIVNGHQGFIDVVSEPGKGSTFDIYLPASQKAIVQEKTKSTKISSGTETILLVDDEPMVLDVSRELLSSLGYRVYLAGSGQEAIAVYMEKQKEIDLIILDMIMPGISGGETFDQLRAVNPNIRVLLSSGYSLEGQAKQILDRGCNDFIQKPFGFEKLSRKVREILNH